jgi:hypothetical protein
MRCVSEPDLTRRQERLRAATLSYPLRRTRAAMLVVVSLPRSARAPRRDGQGNCRSTAAAEEPVVHIVFLPEKQGN